MEIHAEHQLRGMVDNAERAQKIGERNIAKPGFRLGFCHIRIYRNCLVIRQIAHKLHDFADGFLRLVTPENNIGHGNGAGIDERIARPALFALKLDNRIKRRPRRLAPDLRP